MAKTKTESKATSNFTFKDAEVIRVIATTDKVQKLCIAYGNEVNKGRAYVTTTIFDSVLNGTIYEKGDKLTGCGHLIVDNYKDRYEVNVIVDELN